MRFYRLGDLYYFMHDEETMIYRMLGLVHYGKWFLIGGVTPLHIHTTPYHYYISALILFLGKQNPLSWGIFSALLGVVTTLVIFIVGRKMLSLQLGIFASFLYANSYLASLFDRHYWPLTSDPILGVVVFYCLWQIIQKRLKFIYLLTIVLIIGLSSDWSNLLFLAITLAAWIIYRLPLRKKEIYFAAILFLLSLLPLVLFDIRHQGSNLAGIRLFLAERGEKLGWSVERFRNTLLFMPQTLSRLLFVFGDQEVARQYTYCPSYSLERLQAVPWWFTTFVILSFFIILWRLNKKLSANEKLFSQLIIIFFLVAFASINLYGNIFTSKLHDHYLATLFGVAFLFYGYLLTHLWKRSFGKFITIAILGIFSVANVTSLVRAENVIGYKHKVSAVNYAIDRLRGKDFALESLGSCYKWGGWRYLFAYLGQEPVKSYTDHNYFWLYDKPPARDHPDWLIVMVTSEIDESAEFKREYRRYQAGTIDRARFGAIEVLLVDNRSHEYDCRF